MQKRGQITVFIVVGIIILFAVGFVLYIASIQPGLQIFGVKETEIQQYIGSCLELTTEQGITLIGNTGGYLQTPEEIALNERAYFSFGRNTEPKIPLWYYRGEPRIPEKSFIAAQIANYTTQNIDACLGNFELFKEKYAIKLIGNVSTEVTIADDSVTAKIIYPLELEDKLTGALTRLDFISRTLDVNLGRMHDMAVDILKTETRSLFFENITVDLLASHPDIPFTGMDVSCAPLLWRKSEIVENARNMVYYNVRKVTVAGNRPLFESNDLYAQNHFIFPLENRYRGITAVFSYPQTARFELHVRPNDREFIRSNLGRSQDQLIRFFCINTWHFTYDVEYPLLTVLQDTDAFDDKGFTFNFAFPVTINHNQGDKRDFSITQFDSPDLNYEFCARTNTNPTDIRVRNAYTFEELYGAKVDYKCVRYLCELGETKADGGIYRLRAKLPSTCTNGLLTATLDNYLEGSAVYAGEQTPEILIKPIKKLKVNFIKHDSTDFDRTEALKAGETATLVLSSTSEPGFERIYTSENPLGEFEMIDGEETYTIEALLVQDGERLMGGYVGTWSPKYNELAGATEVTFHVVQKLPLAITEEEQIAAADYLFGDKTYQESLKPTFT